MAQKIFNIQAGSLAEQAGIKSQESIIAINDHAIHDFLDLQFYSADEKLKFELRSINGHTRAVQISQDWSTPLGIEPAPHRCRNCANNCIFCFIDQMRPDIRNSLYIKDDDFRLSFVYGNFITLTNLSESDLNRITEQRLSPLYISVHTTNTMLHKKMMRYKHEFNLMEKLQLLALKGIEFHTQIVVVPGWNDGTELKQTLSDLTSSTINALSVGIVPVGLTKYRKSLTTLRKINYEEANQIIDLAADFPATYCSDEIFLTADKKIPELEYYDDFPQLENGIGMLRLLQENWLEKRDEFLAFLQQYNKKLVMITAESVFTAIQEISHQINLSLPNKSRVCKIINHFLGKTVTVAGLMPAEDIIAQVNLLADEIPVFPSNMFNHNNLTIDNISLGSLQKLFNRDILLIDEEFADWELIKLE